MNRLIQWLKWPIAIIAIIFLIPITYRLWRVFDYIIDHISLFSLLFYGMAGYAVLWVFWLKNSQTNRWFRTLEHELTHSLVALLFFRRIIGLNVTHEEGGYLTIEGGVNWPILIAPYFLPTLSLFTLCLLLIAAQSAQATLLFMLGMSMAYDMITTYKETHKNQTDLIRVGKPFAWVFLPTAHVTMLLILLTAIPNTGLSVGRSLAFAFNDIINVIN